MYLSMNKYNLSNSLVCIKCYADSKQNKTIYIFQKKKKDMIIGYDKSNGSNADDHLYAYHG